MILRVRDKEGNVQEVTVIKGNDYILTEEDKEEIANLVAGMINATGAISVTSELTEERVLELINDHLPSSGEGVSY